MNDATSAPIALPTPAAPYELLRVEDLRCEFRRHGGWTAAVDGLSLTVRRGEIVGLVGESGSGKSVTGYSILGLIDPPGRISAGSVNFAGLALRDMKDDELRALRGDRIAMIFQDPMLSLHPTLRIGTQMIDCLMAHRTITRAAARARAIEALTQVGIPAAATRMRAYPHQLSGGMRQRVAIAIALLNEPELIIADEPTTGLDVTIQAQILAQMQALTARSGTAMIWITHDLAVVANFADTVAVMYAGNIVEQGPIDRVMSQPAHPYTRSLLSCIPSRSQGAARLPQIPGSITSASQETGCRFRARCALAQADCTTPPPMVTLSAGHQVRCVRPGLTPVGFA